MRARGRVLRASAAARQGMAGGPRAKTRAAPSPAVHRVGRIALFGLFGSGNLGNDGSLKAMVEFLAERCPSAQLVCICRETEAVGRAFGIAAVELRRKPSVGVARLIDRALLKVPGKLCDFMRAVRVIRRADVMIVPGTGILDDFGEKPLGMPFDILKWCLAARLAGTRIAFVSVGAGPIRNRWSRWLMVAAAGMADYRSFRDRASVEFMQRIGAHKPGDRLYPDLAFRLAVPQGRAPPREGAPVVGVGVMAYRGWYGYRKTGEDVFARYIDKMTRFVSALMQRGHMVRLLIGDEEDRIAVEALQAAVSALPMAARTDRMTVEMAHSLDEVMAQIGKVDIVVATRFHNVVCALKLARPTISIGYASKNDLLMAQMGLADYCQHIDDFDPDRLVTQVCRLHTDRERIARVIAARTAEYAASLKRQEAHLLATLLLSDAGGPGS